MRKFIYITVMLLCFACGNIKSEYEKQHKNNVVVDSTSKMQSHTVICDSAFVVIGSYKNINNAQYYSSSIDLYGLIPVIKNINGYYRVIIDSVNLLDTKDIIKTSQLKEKTDVYIIKKCN